MALIDCEECGKQISDKAPHCVSCGAPIVRKDAPAELFATGGSTANTLEDARIWNDGRILSYNKELDLGLLMNVVTKQTYQFVKRDIIGDSDLILSGSHVRFALFADDRVEITGSSSKVGESQLKSISSSAAHRLPSPAVNVPITRKYIWQIFVLGLVILYWIAKGTPSPFLLFTESAAKEACLKLANENRDSVFFDGGEEITANDTWLKDGKRVVQLLQNDGENLKQVMCVYGNGMVQIPSIFEQAKWR